MEFRVLGPLQVVDGDHTVDLGSRKQRCLIALFALHADRVVSLDRMVDALWQGEPPPGYAATVHAYVSRLRRILEPERDGRASSTMLVREAPGYRLRIADDALDARQFEHLVEDAGRALSAGTEADVARAAELLDQAMALWRGDVLADVDDADFVTGEATRLEQLRLDAIEQQLEAALLLGRHGNVVAEANRLLGDHPYRERLRGQLMLALYRSGQQADALRIYREGRTLLVEELGIEPGPALQELEEAILLQKSHLAWQPLARQSDVSPAAAGRAR